MRPLALLAALLLAVPAAHADDRTWDGGGDGVSWSDPDNWSDEAVPGAADRALITMPGTYTVRLTGDVTVAALTLGGAPGTQTLDATGFTLNVGAGPSAVEASGVLLVGHPNPGAWALAFDGPLAVRGRLDWEGGVVYAPTYYQPPGPKVLTVEAGGEMRWRGATERRLEGTLDNRGTVRWEGATTHFAQGYAHASSGTFELAAATDVTFQAVGVNSLGPWVFTNTGVVRKSGAGTATFLNVELQTVGGSVDVQAGGLVLDGRENGSVWDDAAIDVAAGAALRLEGFGRWHVVRGTLAGSPAGDVVVTTQGSGGITTDAPGAALDVAGTGVQFRWAELGGRNVGSGPQAAPTNRGLLRFVDSDNYVSGAFVNDAGGTVRFEGGRLLYYMTASFTNAGLLVLAPAADADFITGGINGIRPGPLVNTGTVRKSGAATVTSNVEFVHDGGTVDVQAGTLRVGWGGRFEDATVAVAAGAALRLEGGGPPTVVAGTLAGEPAGQFAIRQRTLVADEAGGRLAIGGTGLSVEYQGTLGGLDGTAVRPAPVNGGLLVFADVDAGFGGPSRNEGTLRWTNGTLRLPQGGTFTNAGVVELAAPGQVFGGSSFGANPASIVNEAGGTIRKTGAGAVELHGNVTNRGRLVVAEGALVVARLNDNVFIQTADAVLAGTGTLDLSQFQIVPTRVLSDGTTMPGPEDGAGVDTLFVRGPLSHRRVELDLAGAGLLEHDRLELGGTQAPIDLTATTLVVRPVGGFTVTPGQAFDVIGGPVAGPVLGIVSTQPDVTYVASYPAEGGVRLTAVPREGATLVADPAALVNSGTREVDIVGTAVGPGLAARLECVACLDQDEAAPIEGEVVSVEGAAARVRFDVRSVRTIGEYELVVETPGAGTARVPMRVYPFLALTVFQPQGPMGVAVRPAPWLSWSTVGVFSLTNSPEPSLSFVDVVPPANPHVRVEINAAWHGGGAPLWVRGLSPDPSAELLFQIPPLRAGPLEIGTGIDPEHVVFPAPLAGGGPPAAASAGAAAGGAGGGDPDPAVFGQDVAFEYHGDMHASREAMREIVEQAFLQSGPGPMNDYINNLVPGDLQASYARLDAAVEQAMFELFAGTQGNQAALSQREMMDRVLDVLHQTNPQPPGFRDAAEQTWRDNFEELFRDHEQDTVDALRETIQDPRPEVRDVTLDGVAAVEGALRRDDVLALLDLTTRDDARLLLERRLRSALQEEPGTPVSPLIRELLYEITGPWDPNDKTTDLADATCELGFVTVDGEEVPRCTRYFVDPARADSALVYTIHFENQAEATAPAEFITVTDTLDARLDPATLHVWATSSDSTFAYTVEGQVVTFRFPGIFLPPNVNAPEGQGFVRYSVRPRPGWPVGEPIRNRASIVFDFNPPILTPTVEHVLRAGGGGAPEGVVLDNVWPNPAPTSTRVRFGLPEPGPVALLLYDLRGREVLRVLDEAMDAGWHTVELSTAGLASGVYVVQLRSGDRAQARALTVVR